MAFVQDVAAAFNAAGIDYVIAGGMAVLLHGHSRLTVDVDVAIDLTTRNVTTALHALGELGLRPRLPVPAAAFADEVIRSQWVRDRNLIAFTMCDPQDARREVDLFAVLPIPFIDLFRNADLVLVNDVPIRIASLRDLVTMKKASGRPQDLADIAALALLHPDQHLDDS